MTHVQNVQENVLREPLQSVVDQQHCADEVSVRLRKLRMGFRVPKIVLDAIARHGAQSQGQGDRSHATQTAQCSA